MSHLRSTVKHCRVLRTPLFMIQNACKGFCSVLSQGAAQPDGGSAVHYLAAMVRVKDEARFLPEWIAHHLNLGIEHFYIYDNNSTDGTKEVIAPFMEGGLVTYVAWPIVPAYPSCFLDFLDRFGARCRWVAFFDADEFLFESVPGATVRVLMKNEARPAVAINWRYFGSSGYKSIPTGLVTERFTQADALGDEHVKVIARPSEVFRCRNTHNFYYRRGHLAVTPDGRRVYGSFSRPHPQPVLVLHHYVYRSREDYERKVRRGSGDARGEKDQGRHIILAQTEFHRHNEVIVDVPRETVGATADVLSVLGFALDLHTAS